MAVTAEPLSSRAVGEARQSQLRLVTSVRLRWFAVTGQLVAVGFVYLGLGFTLPLGPCLLLIVASAWLNILLRVWLPARHRMSTGLATTLLVYDILQLGALLYLTGGATNPFLVLIVAPVTISAATLPAGNTLLIGTVAAVVTAAMALVHQPLPWLEGRSVSLPWIYTAGVLASVYATMIFLGFYAWRLAKEAREMSTALAATELVLAREQRLHALDGLAAAAAHELGTPLATIALTARELERDLTSGTLSLPDCLEDVKLLGTQALRCREILQKLSRTPDAPDPVHGTLSITQLVEEAARPYRGRHPIEIDAKPESGLENARAAGGEPIGLRQPGVVYGLGNLIENAVAHASNAVEITLRWSATEVRIVIADDGSGFTPEILESLGDPYVTSRPLHGSLPADASNRRTATQKGLGLGFFIAKTLLERSGATLTAGNRSDGAGAAVTVVWPRTAFQASGM